MTSEGVDRFHVQSGRLLAGGRLLQVPHLQGLNEPKDGFSVPSVRLSQVKKSDKVRSSQVKSSQNKS